MISNSLEVFSNNGPIEPSLDMPTATQPKTGELKRGFSFKAEAMNESERRIELAFSSELPYRRYFGMEVLGHGVGEVDLSRLGDGTHPLLLNHDRDKQIGVIEVARIDGDKIGRVTARFGKSTLAEEIFQDVKDGIRSQASVAYEVNDWDVHERDDGTEEWRATNWTPFEVSIVSIAADPSVGVGREKEKSMSDKNKPDADAGEGKRQADATPPIDLENVRKEAARVSGDKERQRVKSIHKMGVDHDCMAEAQKAIEEDMPESEFQAKVLDSIRASRGKPKAMSTDVQAVERRTIGELFTASEQFRSAGYKVGNRIQVRVEIPKMKFERATLSISGESLTSITDLPGVVVPERRVLRVADIFPQGQINAGSLRYVREASYTNAATAVAEGSAKPAATIDLEQVTDTVEKQAVTVKVTDEMLADFPATQAFINQYLSYSVQQLEDTHLLSGSGSSNQIRGVLNVSGVQTVSAAAYSVPHDAIDKAIEKVRDTGNTEPNWIVVNPADWGNLKRTKDSNGQYYGGGPFTGQYGAGPYSNIGNMWGLPVIVTSAMSQGTALVGNFAIGAMIFRRLGLMVESTNSNEDDFLKNLVALRAEQRMCLATWKPLAFCTVTAIPA